VFHTARPDETLRWEELRTLAPPQATVHSKLRGEELRPLTPPLAGLGLANGTACGARLPRLQIKQTERARGGATTAHSPAGKYL
jgi:hypothetical protein